eukprot:490305-Karenia_brevis.AAC.1
MVDASRILSHLSQAQQFVIRLQSGSSQCPAAVIFSMLQRIDESIRSRWATAFRATLADNQVDRLTLSEVIGESESFAASLWLWQYQPSTPASSSGNQSSPHRGKGRGNQSGTPPNGKG